MSAAGYIEPTDAAETAKELAQYKSLLSKLHGLLREAPSTQYITGAGGIPSGASPAVRVPVLGKVPAGPLMEAIEEAEEHYYVPASDLAGIRQPFMVVVRGESMEPALHDGEYVLVDPDRDQRPNDIYLVRYDGETAIKRLRIEGEMLVLVSDNPAYQDIRVNNAEAHVVGVAIDTPTPPGCPSLEASVQGGRSGR